MVIAVGRFVARLGMGTDDDGFDLAAGPFPGFDASG